MFIRKNRNKSGSTSVRIIDKSNGYRIYKTVGCSSDPEEIQCLVAKAQQIIRTCNGQQPEFSFKTKEELAVEEFVKELSNSQIHTIGPELIFGTLFDRIGFNVVKEELFRHIVVARLAYPTSKLKTADYLYRYRGITVTVDEIYRFLDKLRYTYKEDVERCAFEYTKHILKTITVVFYDMTSLYFESEDEDDLRKIGFSKDGKFQKPQIMLGLLVGEHGYPIGYDIFEGNVFEGHTLLPVLNKIQDKHKIDDPVVVADAALLSQKNMKNLAENNYSYIIGARIKNETDKIKEEILQKASGIRDGQNFMVKKPDGTKLIVTYSDKRKNKDTYNRERGLIKLRKRIRTGRLTKDSINNRGYNKFLRLKGNVEVEINEEKVKQDTLWDGLKGYITNTKLPAKKIVENYRHLWQIEKAFRISKTDLKIRPVHHYLRKRIEAHICVAFVAYTIYKELERLLYEHKVGFSPKRASELTHNMYQLEYQAPKSLELKKILLKMDREQQKLYDIIHK